MASASSGQGSAIKAGGAFVEISAKDSLSKALTGLKTKVMTFAAGLKTVGVAGAALGGAVLTPLAMLFKGGVDRAEEITKLADSLGFTVEQMQKLKYAADVAGVSLDDVMKNPDKFKKLMDEAPLMDAGQIKEAVAAQQEFRKTLISLQSAMLPIIKTISPIIKLVGEFARRNSGLLITVAGVAAVVAGLGIGLVMLGTVLSAVITVGGAVASVLGAISLPALAITAVVVGLVGGLGYLATQAFPNTWKAAKQFFGDMLDIAGETIGGIVAAISKGDVEQAWTVLCAGLNAAWKTVVANMTYAWVSFKATIIDTFRDAITGVKMAINDFAAWLLRNDPTGIFSGGMTDVEINAARDEINNDLMKGRGEEQRKADDFRKKQIADAQAELAAAKAKLGQEVDKAKMQVKGESSSGNDIAPRIAAVRGAFRIADAAQQFGERGNPVVKRLDVMIEGQKKVIQAIEKKGMLV